MDIVSPSPMPRPGKSAMAVGQMAKAAVAEARAAGAELPKNAQGVAASAIARGAEPASIFEALVAPPPSDEPVVPVDDGSGDVGEEPTEAVDETSGDLTDTGLPVTMPADFSVDDASTALKLLKDALEPSS